MKVESHEAKSELDWGEKNIAVRESFLSSRNSINFTLRILNTWFSFLKFLYMFVVHYLQFCLVELVHFIIRMLQLEWCHFDFTCLKEMTVSSVFQNQRVPAANVLVMSSSSAGAGKTLFVVLSGAVHIKPLVSSYDIINAGFFLLAGFMWHHLPHQRGAGWISSWLVGVGFEH